MNYDSVSKVLEELVVELKGKGIVVPQHIIDSFKSGRTLMNVYNTDPTELDLAMATTPYLQIAELDLLYLADSEVGKEYAYGWQERINGAYMEKKEDAAPLSTYVSGVPKTDHWVRIRSSEFAIEGDLSELINQHNLSILPQKDGYLLIYGKKEDISSILKAVRDKVKKQNEE